MAPLIFKDGLMEMDNGLLAGVHLWRITPERRVVLPANSTAHLAG